ncbi:hypothetical protein V5O48_013774 [Marasmius crinis-equi]|uniref:HNH endonuclease n=1 Tax=Marasmius crinis-equi TaxID=585013 RepID=A0ABR3EZA1_9AGAR
MATYRGISAWVGVNGDKLAQHGVIQGLSDDEVPQVSCWIPSRVNDHFTVYLEATRKSYKKKDLAGYLQIDGKSCGCLMLKAGQRRTACKRAVRTSESQAYQFRFEKILLTKDAKFRGKSHPRLGEIRIIVKAANIQTRDQVEKRTRWFPHGAVEKRTVHVKNSKGLKHIVGFSAGDSGKPKNGRKMQTFLDVTPKETIVEFVFRYAPYEKLQADRIALKRKNSRPSKPRKERVRVATKKVTEGMRASMKKKKTRPARKAKSQA